MRKFLLFALVLINISTFAQYNGVLAPQKNNDCVKIEALPPVLNKKVKPTRASMDTLVDDGNKLYFDFSDVDGDGNYVLPSGWITVDRTGNDYEFVVTDTTYTGAYTNGADGSNSYSDIESSTAANGFLHFPADYYNCKPGVWPREMVSDITQMDAYVETDWMDMSGGEVSGAVIMRFSAWFRFCCSSTNTKFEVQVTTDGTNWTQLSAMADVVINHFPSKTNDLQYHIEEFNLTEAISADPTHVKIRFAFYDGSHYFISIDDLVFIEPYANEVSIIRTYAGTEGIYTTSSGYDNDYNTRYSAVPYNIKNKLHLGAKLHQVGNEAVDAKVNFTIIDNEDASEFWSGTSTTTIASFKPSTGDSILYTDTTDNFDNAPVFYAPALTKDDLPKNYTFKYEAVSSNTDANTTNNIRTYPYQQTLGYYSYHTGNIANIQISLSQYVDNDGNPLGKTGDAYGVLYDFEQEEGDDPFKIWGMRFYVGGSTNLNADGDGVILLPELYIWDDATGDWLLIEDIEADVITIKETMIDTFVYVVFDYNDVENYDFEQGTYLVALNELKDNNCKFYLGANTEYSQGGSHLRIKKSDEYNFDSGYLKNASAMVDVYTNLEALRQDCKVCLVCNPDFKADKIRLLVGDTVKFTDLSACHPNTWSWEFEGGTSSSSSIENPEVVYNTSGFYDVTLSVNTDAGGDTSITKTNYIEVGDSLKIKITTTSTSCGEDDGQAHAEVNGGSGNYLIEWSNGDKGADADSLSIGSYTVKITDTYYNSLKNINFTITESEKPNVDAGDNQLGPVGTFDLHATVSGGSGSYTYTWSPVDSIDGAINSKDVTTIVLHNTTNFIFTVKDSKGCKNSDTVKITITGIPLNLNLQATDTLICIGETVTINSNAGGGSGHYIYEWTNNQNSSTKTSENINVSPEVTTIYTAKVTDTDDGSFESADITITVNSTPTADFSYTQNRNEITFSNNSTNANSYYWDFEDGNSSTIKNPIHIYTERGSYDVKLTVTNACGDVDFTKTIVISDLGTSINMISKEDIQIYPNPTKGQITVRGKDIVRVEVSTANGQKVQDIKSYSNRLNISLAKEAKGLYFIKVTTKQGVVLQKIVLE